MESKLELLNDIFEADLTLDDLGMGVKQAFKWDSFHIMNFLVEVEDRFQKRITIEAISKVKEVQELLDLIEME